MSTHLAFAPAGAAQELATQAAPAAVRFAGAGVRLGGRWVWRDVSFAVSPGECVAVIGPNGAGKSTLLKATLGLLPLHAGRAEVLGAPVRRGNAQIGYLPQARAAAAELHVRGRDVVRLGLEGTRWGLPLPWRWGRVGARRAAAEQRIQAVIDLVRASAYADRPLDELSGGERQRLLIAQALVTQPRLLLLDEPLEGLDLRNQQAVAALVGELSRAHGIATVIVLHDVNPLLPYVDRVLYVAAGRTTIGRPAEVITAPTLSALYGSPVEVLRGRDGRIVVVGLPEEVSYHAHAH